MGRGLRRIERNGLAHRGDGVVELAFAGEDEGEVGVGVGHPGGEADGFAERLLREGGLAVAHGGGTALESVAYGRGLGLGSEGAQGEDRGEDEAQLRMQGAWKRSGVHGPNDSG